MQPKSFSRLLALCSLGVVLHTNLYAEPITDGYCKPHRLEVSDHKLVIACSETTNYPDHVHWFVISESHYQDDPRFVDRAITLASTAIVADLTLRLTVQPAANSADDWREITHIEIFK